MQTLKSDFGVGVLLGDGGGVIGMKTEVAADEKIGGAAQRERKTEASLCLDVEAVIPVDPMSIGFLCPVFLMTFRATWPEELAREESWIIGRVEELFCHEESTERERDDVGVVKTAEVDDAGFFSFKAG